jgi:hypothetical protein
VGIGFYEEVMRWMQLLKGLRTYHRNRRFRRCHSRAAIKNNTKGVEEYKGVDRRRAYND